MGEIKFRAWNKKWFVGPEEEIEQAMAVAATLLNKPEQVVTQYNDSSN